MNPAVDNEFQQWLSQINQVCGNFTGRLLTERYTGVLDTHFAKGLKLSTVTTSGVNLSRTWQEVKGSDDAWFYTVFQLSGQAIMEQDERQVQIGAGDITLAGETGMSIRSLYRMFADKGLVVAQYIRNRRLDFCADAIRHAADDEKLAGIGFHWGFSDQSHFSTVFKQRFGMTPGEYRRKFR
ncbi:helix-turn-helix domain-containing protein [Escherichia coli O13,129,135:H11]